jgi:hypothetical protein
LLRSGMPPYGKPERTSRGGNKLPLVVRHKRRPWA